MGCPSEVEVGDNLVFSICCHDPDTGVLTDADTAPAYRVYEDETSTAILTGSMAKLDDTNTTGFYSESIACTAGNGFESGKTYTVYIEATVDSDTGGISYGVKAKTTVVPDAAGTAASLHSTTDALVGGLNNLSVADIIAGISDGIYDFQEITRLIFSACCLKTSGGGTTTLVSRDSADSKDRITLTVDEDGNRTGVTLDGS